VAVNVRGGVDVGCWLGGLVGDAAGADVAVGGAAGKGVSVIDGFTVGDGAGALVSIDTVPDCVITCRPVPASGHMVACVSVTRAFSRLMVVVPVCLAFSVTSASTTVPVGPAVWGIVWWKL